MLSVVRHVTRGINVSQTTEMQWRVCPRFPDYEVSECGDMRRATAIENRPAGYRLTGFVNVGGYLAYAVTMPGETRNRSVPAYRLVAEAFLGPPPTPKHEVAHNNGSKVSAHYTHLRWATRQENHADMQVHKTAVKGGRNGRAVLTDESALECRREYRRLKARGYSNTYRGFKDLMVKYGIGRTALRMLGRGETWRHLPDDEHEL